MHVKPQVGHDQVVLEYRWSLNTGGHKSYSIMHIACCAGLQDLPTVNVIMAISYRNK